MSADRPWLVVIDPQRIFAASDSDWGSPMWSDAVANIRRLAAGFPGRVLVTRWVPPSDPAGSWASYMAAWPFADRPADDPLFDVVEDLDGVYDDVVTASTFGKWDALAPAVGSDATLVVAGVSTDCCVISTVLPAAAAGATLVVATDACAGSTPENHAAALTVLGLYPPQVMLRTTAEVLAAI